ncbi:hypothetical protein HanIR_Chr09g0391201 [Helianthus annuus]|nr:hypothetical protein HanIR_Chr09g0391201 [Helianthus annuus]
MMTRHVKRHYKPLPSCVKGWDTLWAAKRFGKRSSPLGNTIANHLYRAVRGWDRCLVTDRGEGGKKGEGMCVVGSMSSQLITLFFK